MRGEIRDDFSVTPIQSMQSRQTANSDMCNIPREASAQGDEQALRLQAMQGSRSYCRSVIVRTAELRTTWTIPRRATATHGYRNTSQTAPGIWIPAIASGPGQSPMESATQHVAANPVVRAHGNHDDIRETRIQEHDAVRGRAHPGSVDDIRGHTHQSHMTLSGTRKSSGPKFDFRHQKHPRK